MRRRGRDPKPETYHLIRFETWEAVAVTSEKSPRIPKYRRQKRPNSTDHAFVELGGRRFYLGPYGSTESQQEYHRLIGEWIASGRQVPVPSEDWMTDAEPAGPIGQELMYNFITVQPYYPPEEA